MVVAAAGLLAACGTNQPSPGEEIQRLADELKTDTASQIYLAGSGAVVTSQGRTARSESAGGRIETGSSEQNHALRDRPLSGFDVYALAERMKAINCADGQEPTIRASSLFSEALLIKDGCFKAGLVADDSEYEVRTTLLDGRELTPFEGWSADAIDIALEDLAVAVGPNAKGVTFVPAEESSGFEDLYVEAFATSGDACIPSVRRFGGQSPTKIGLGLMFPFCSGKPDGPPNDKEIPLADLSGAEIMNAMDRLAKDLAADSRVDEGTPMRMWLEWRKDELVLSANRAEGMSDEKDLRVPLKLG